MDIVIDYEPTDKQILFHQSDADEVLYGGAAGGGKSRAVVMDAVGRCLAHPGTEAYLFRRTYPELKDGLMKEALRRLPPDLYNWNSQFHDMTLINGSILHFRHCRNMDDALTYQGSEFHWLYIDELTHFSLDEYDYLKTRLRAVKSLGIIPRVRCTSNPGGPGHGWVKEYFVNYKPYEKHTEEIYSPTLNETEITTVQYIPALVTDNPHMGKKYIFELEKKPEALRKALLNGDWNVFEGQAFMEWRDDPEHYKDRKWTHVIEPFKIPKSWRRWRSFDFGYAKPFSIGWWTQDNDGRMIRYDELYGWNGTPNVGCRWHPPQIAKEIRRIEESRGDFGEIQGIADPSIFDDSQGDSIADQMAREGVYFGKGDNARIDGKMQLHYRLAFDEEGYPGLYSFNWCRNFIRIIPTLPYSLKRKEDVDTDAEDHIYDETRYMIQEHPIPAQINHMVRRLFDPLATPRVERNKFLSM